VHSEEQADSLSTGTISALAEDANQGIWLATELAQDYLPRCIRVLFMSDITLPILTVYSIIASAVCFPIRKVCSARRFKL